MKKRLKWRFTGIAVILIPPILAAIFFSIASVSMLFIEYPWERGSHWVCEDPDFTLSYSVNSLGSMVSEEILIWEGREIRVDLAMGQGYYAVFPKYSNHYDDRLLTGTWKFKRGNLVLRIEEDFIFDNQYKELVFHPQDKRTASGRPFSFRYHDSQLIRLPGEKGAFQPCHVGKWLLRVDSYEFPLWLFLLRQQAEFRRPLAQTLAGDLLIHTEAALHGHTDTQIFRPAAAGDHQTVNILATELTAAGNLIVKPLLFNPYFPHTLVLLPDLISSNHKNHPLPQSMR